MAAEIAVLEAKIAAAGTELNLENLYPDVPVLISGAGLVELFALIAKLYLIVIFTVSPKMIALMVRKFLEYFPQLAQSHSESAR